MKKLSILSMLLLFISMGNIQAQTVKEESRKQKKAEQELLDQMFFDEAKQAIEMKNWKQIMLCLNMVPQLSFLPIQIL